MLRINHIINNVVPLHYNQYFRCHLGNHLVDRSPQRCDFWHIWGEGVALFKRAVSLLGFQMQTLLSSVGFLNNTLSFWPAPGFTYAKRSENIVTYCPHKTFGLQMLFHTASTNVLFCPPTVTLPGALLAPVSSTSSSLSTRRSSANSSSSMQTSYRLPNPLPPLPVRKGVRGRRPKSQTIALLKAAAEAAAAAAVNGASQIPARTGFEGQLAPRPHKKRGPKPKNKVRCYSFCNLSFQGPGIAPFSI